MLEKLIWSEKVWNGKLNLVMITKIKFVFQKVLVATEHNVAKCRSWKSWNQPYCFQKHLVDHSDGSHLDLCAKYFQEVNDLISFRLQCFNEFFLRFIFSPIGEALKVDATRSLPPTFNKRLETAYKTHGWLHDELVT